MKKAIITPLVVNLLIYFGYNYGLGSGQGSFVLLVLIIRYAGLIAGLFVGTHCLIALFFFFYSDRSLPLKNRIINVSVYLFFGVIIVIPYLLYITRGHF